MEGKLVKGEALMEASAVGNEKRVDLRGPIKTAVVTTVGAGLGVIGAIAGVTVAAAVLEVALPVGICLWAGGVTCGAAGLALRLGKKNGRRRDSRRQDNVSKG